MALFNDKGEWKCYIMGMNIMAMSIMLMIRDDGNVT